MKRFIPSFLVVLLFIGISSCESGPVKISEVYLAKKNGDDFDKVKNFRPDDGPFYCIVDLSHFVENTKIEAVWTAVDIPLAEIKNEEIDNYKLRLKDGQTHIDFSLSIDGAWPKGKYNIEIFIDGKSQESIDFKVK